MSQLIFLYSFNGRIQRGHWWAAQISSGVLIYWMTYTLRQYRATWEIPHPGFEITFVVFLALAILILIPLNRSFSVRRLHDVGASGWLVLMTLVPYLGVLLNLIFMGILEGTKGPNKYGPSAKYPEPLPS